MAAIILHVIAHRMDVVLMCATVFPLHVSAQAD